MIGKIDGNIPANIAFKTAASNSEQQTSKNTTSPPQSDSVKISKKGKKLNDLHSSFLDGAGADGVITGDELRAFRDKKLSEATNQLKGILKKLGVDSGAEFSVDYNPHGNQLEVEGKLEDSLKGKLEETINNNNDFYDAYKAASSTAQVIAAGEAHVNFAEAYKQNPKTAVNQYSWLFNADWDFKAEFSGGQLNLVEAFDYPA